MHNTVLINHYLSIDLCNTIINMYCKYALRAFRSFKRFLVGVLEYHDEKIISG